MTGAYLRVKRDGKWEPIEVEDLTDDERKTILGERKSEELLRWLNLTCKALVECEKFIIKKLGQQIGG